MTTADPAATTTASLARRALLACRPAIVSAGVFSLVVNVLMLTPAIYMLQVYDRVLASGSEATLLMLTLIAAFVFLVCGGLEWVRGQLMVLVSARFDALTSGEVYDAVIDRAPHRRANGPGVQPLGDATLVVTVDGKFRNADGNTISQLKYERTDSAGPAPFDYRLREFDVKVK